MRKRVLFVSLLLSQLGGKLTLLFVFVLGLEVGLQLLADSM